MLRCSDSYCVPRQVEGWIFDIYQHRGRMILWVKTRDSCIRLSDQWQPSLYVAGEDNDLDSLPHRLGLQGVSYDKRRLRLHDRTLSPVLRIPVSNRRHASTLAERVARYGGYSRFQLYNVDIPPDQMYLYEKDLFPLANTEVHSEGPRLRWRVKDSVERRDYSIPHLTSVELEVENGSRRLPRLDDPVLKITLQTPDEAVAIEGGSEESRLLRLCETVRQLDPDIILTKGGNALLLPRLVSRAVKNDVSREFTLGRENVPVRPTSGRGGSYFSYGRVYYKPRQVRVFGRLHIDRDTSFLSPSCGLEGLIEVSRLCRMPLHRAVHSTIGSIMTSLQMYHAVRDGVLIPWEKTQVEEFKTAQELVLADRGGLIYEPQVGVHDDVGELDFASLYPMLMMKHNLSPECIPCDCCPDSPHKVPELGTPICQKRQGLIPQALELLIEKRLSYKRMRKETSDEHLRDVYNQRQAALKWILVCCFGYLGYRNARFGRIEAHIATCAFARDILTKAARLAEERDFKVVHGIVDSLWLKKPHADTGEFVELCRVIQDRLGFPLSFEGRYRWIVFLSSKTRAGNPVLNRYYGVFENGKIKARGIELQRRDTPKLIKDFQTEMLHCFTQASSSQQLRQIAPETVNILTKYMRRIASQEVDAEELAIKRYLSKNPSAYAHDILQAIVARQLLKAGVQVSAGQPVRYVITDADHASPSLRATAVELAPTPLRYDVEKYRELLVSAANTLLSSLGYTVHESTMRIVEQDPQKKRGALLTYK